MTTAPRPTMSDVAAAAGVSRALVSIVIRGAAGASEATRQHVLDVARELGYRRDTRARLLRSSRTRLIGVVFNVTEPYHAELVEMLYAAGEAENYAITLSATGPRRGEQPAIESLLDLGAEALVLIAPTGPAEDLAQLPVPVVSMLRPIGDATAGNISSVSSDETAGIRLAMEHLRGLGHLRIAHIDGGGAVGSAARRRAYEQVMKENHQSAQLFPGGPLESDGSRAAARLLLSMGQRNAKQPGKPKAANQHIPDTEAPWAPTAVVVFNDRCALGALDTFRTAGLDVPGDLSVVGYDNSRMARLDHINLTSIGQNGPALAAGAVGAAVAMLDGGPARHDVVAPYLVAGGTTSAPKP